MAPSLNDIEAQIKALENVCSVSENASQSASEVEDTSGYESSHSSFSGYSCDSTDSESSDSEGESVVEEDLSAEDKRKTDFGKKADQLSRKKARLGLSDLCFRFLAGKCALEDCIFRHATLDSLNEEDRGNLVRELKRKPFDSKIGSLVKQLNIPVCKTFSKQGACKFQKCRFWHIESENDAKWAGCPFWCELCWKAFTSETQLREHNNGKLHKSNLGRA